LQLPQQGLTLPLFRPNIIDFEASGFGNESYPIEVGVALSSGQIYCTLIKPASNWMYWDQKAEQVHGLSVEVLRAHGKPINIVARELNSFLADSTLYSDGWVVDKPWLSKLYYQCGMTPSFFLSPLENILKENQMEIWTQTKLQVIADLALIRHRASSDALIIQETFTRTLQILLGVDPEFGI
jgi:hypothetical protein